MIFGISRLERSSLWRSCTPQAGPPSHPQGQCRICLWDCIEGKNAHSRFTISSGKSNRLSVISDREAIYRSLITDN